MDLTSKNPSKSRQYKITKYANIENETKGKHDKTVKLYSETASTGFLTKGIKCFFGLNKKQKNCQC